jgi:hypothetical protein
MLIEVKEVMGLPVLFPSDDLSTKDFSPIRETDQNTILFILEDEDSWEEIKDKDVLKIRLSIASKLYKQLKDFKNHSQVMAPLLAVYKVELTKGSSYQAKLDAEEKLRSEALKSVLKAIETFNNHSLALHSSN